MRVFYVENESKKIESQTRLLALALKSNLRIFLPKWCDRVQGI